MPTLRPDYSRSISAGCFILSYMLWLALSVCCRYLTRIWWLDVSGAWLSWLPYPNYPLLASHCCWCIKCIELINTCKKHVVHTFIILLYGNWLVWSVFYNRRFDCSAFIFMVIRIILHVMLYSRNHLRSFLCVPDTEKIVASLILDELHFLLVFLTFIK